MNIWQKIWGQKEETESTGPSCLVICLGNPGKKYEKTRHNTGREAVFRVQAKNSNFSEWTENRKAEALISQGVVAGKMVTLILPQTFMNLSGQSVRKYLRYQAKLPQLIVVHDDIDLPVGTVRLSQDRGAGGHNGVSSIINAIGTKDFVRVRLGVGRDTKAITQHVLESFTPNEKLLVDKSKDKLPLIIETIVREGLALAMNKYNH